MTNPPTYDKSHPDVTNQIRRGLSPGFVEYGPLYTEVPSWNTSRIIIIWDLSPRFVIYGEYPRFDKSHPYMTNPSTPRWVGKTQAVLSTNERPRNWPCDLFSANHKARFHHFKSCKGSPLLKYSVEVCHLDLSNMGKCLAHIDKTEKLQLFATSTFTVP